SMLRIKRLQEQLEEREKDLMEANERLKHMSMTDALTGLDNRRHLEERLTEMFEHAKRLNEPFSCVMCDLDKFKSVNDTYGHQAGDAVLRQLAQLLREQAREIDRVGRYGGEEFMLILPGASADAAVTFAERVRKAVAGRTFSFAGAVIRRTMSCGVAAWPHPGIPDTAALVRAADDALYAAKAQGRNRVVRWDAREPGAAASTGKAPSADERPATETSYDLRADDGEQRSSGDATSYASERDSEQPGERPAERAAERPVAGGPRNGVVHSPEEDR